MILQKTILLSCCLLIFVSVNYSQKSAQITISEIKEIKPFSIPHLAEIADRQVVFKLLNNTQYEITVFGSDLEGELRPIRYLLTYNKKINDWDYPTLNNQPVPWKEVSKIYKNEKLLKPGESITFSSFFSSVSDCGIRFKVTAQVKQNKSKKTQEIRSTEFMIGPCR